MMDAKLQDLERKSSSPQVRPSSPPSQDVAGQVVEELIHGGPRGFPFAFGGPGMPGMGFYPPAMGMPMPFGEQPSQHASQQQPSRRDIPSWGSEVEMPVSESMPPPPLAPPTIQVMAPTDKNAAASRAQTASRAPTHVDIDIVHKKDISNDHSERDLPPLPKTKAETVMSQGNHQHIRGPNTFDSPSSYDPLVPPLPSPAPWDIVTQRLYSWALVWMEKDFVDALENISLGSQVDEFALTIYTMMTFKR
jgi:hypothetical protein